MQQIYHDSQVLDEHIATDMK